MEPGVLGRRAGGAHGVRLGLDRARPVRGRVHRAGHRARDGRGVRRAWPPHCLEADRGAGSGREPRPARGAAGERRLLPQARAGRPRGAREGRPPGGLVRLVVAILLAVSLAGVARASALPPGFVDDVIANGLNQPVNFDWLPDGRVLVVERVTGRVRLARPGVLAADTVGVVPNLRTAQIEQGLLGIAVDPRWPSKPYIYVHSTSSLSPN